MKGIIHWAPAEAVDLEVRLYDYLFKDPDPEDVPEGVDWRENLNPDSLQTITAKGEPALKDAAPGDRVQFERKDIDVEASKEKTPWYLGFGFSFLSF